MALQACQHNKGIAHALISLSATHESLDIGHDPNRQTHLQRLAFNQSSKALRNISTSSISHSVALISCVILICLHHHHDRSLALHLLRAGQRLLAEVRAGRSPGVRQISSVERHLVLKDLAPMFEHLQTSLCERIWRLRLPFRVGCSWCMD